MSKIECLSCGGLGVWLDEYNIPSRECPHCTNGGMSNKQYALYKKLLKKQKKSKKEMDRKYPIPF